MKRVGSVERYLVPVLLAVLVAAAAAPYLGGDAYYNNDEPVHLFNSLLLLDFLRGAPGSFHAPSDWVRLYYLHYPSVAPYVWPPFFYLAELPFLAAFGPALASGQVAIAVFTFLLLAGWYFLMRDLLKPRYALLGCAALLTAPAIWTLSHHVMLEIPAMALMPWAILLARKHVERPASRALSLGAAATTAAMLLTKQHAVLCLPALAVVYGGKEGRAALRKPLALAAWGSGLLVVLAYYLVSFHVQRVNASDTLGGWSLGGHAASLAEAFGPHALGWFGLALAGMALWGGLRFREHRPPAFLAALAAANLVFYLAAGIVSWRYLCYLIPAVLFAGAWTLERMDERAGRATRLAGASLILAAQILLTVRGTPVERMSGMQDVARYAIGQSHTGRVLFVGSNAHSFVHAVRVLDPQLEKAVFRDSKTLYTANWYAGREMRVLATDAAGVERVLKACGVDFLVVDQGDVPGFLEKPLGEALASPAFVPRESFLVRRGERPLHLRTYAYSGVPEAPELVSLTLQTVKSQRGEAVVEGDFRRPLLGPRPADH